MEDYKDRFNKIKNWNCAHLIIPMIFAQGNTNNYILAFNNDKILENKEDTKRFNQRRCMKEILEKSKWYSGNLDGKKLSRADMFTRILTEYIG